MHTSEIALHNIEGVKVNQSFTGRVFGFGTVKIEGTGGGFHHHAADRRSGGLCARHPDRQGTCRRALARPRPGG